MKTQKNPYTALFSSLLSSTSIYPFIQNNERCTLNSLCNEIESSLRKRKEFLGFAFILNDFLICILFNLILFKIQDTRTHIVVELFNTEKSYIESLETVVKVSIYLLDIFI